MASAPISVDTTVEQPLPLVCPDHWLRPDLSLRHRPARTERSGLDQRYSNPTAEWVARQITEAFPWDVPLVTVVNEAWDGLPALQDHDFDDSMVQLRRDVESAGLTHLDTSARLAPKDDALLAPEDDDAILELERASRLQEYHKRGAGRCRGKELQHAGVEPVLDGGTINGRRSMSIPATRKV